MQVLLKGALVAAALFTAAPVFAQDFDFDVGPGFSFGIGPGYYGPDYDYYYGPGYYAPASPPPVYEGRSVAVAPNPNPGDVAYCEQHFRTYNPATGLYRGYDGLYHPCP